VIFLVFRRLVLRVLRDHPAQQLGEQHGREGIAFRRADRHLLHGASPSPRIVQLHRPILGSLLAGALTADGGAVAVDRGTWGLWPGAAHAVRALRALPQLAEQPARSGSWLNSVKVVLGFAEIALAFKFLSNADLVKQWLIVPYELFMIVWVICALGSCLPLRLHPFSA
jgi:hypothetical protein